MGSYYLTYQPAAVVEEIMEGEYRVKTERYKEISREVGYNPIFLIPMENKVVMRYSRVWSLPAWVQAA